MSALKALGAVEVMFNYQALLDPFWLQSFDSICDSYGEGAACYDETSRVLTYYEGQLSDLQNSLTTFAETAE